MLEIDAKLKPQLEEITGRRRLQSTGLRFKAIELHSEKELHLALLHVFKLCRQLFSGIFQERAHFLLERLQVLWTGGVDHFLSFVFTC